MTARDLAIADVTITLTDAVRGNFVDGDDESLAAIAVGLVDVIEGRYAADQPAAEDAGKPRKGKGSSVR